MLHMLLFVLTLFSLSFGRTVPVIFLKQVHFATGSLRITKPGKYILCEDIVFNPRRKLDDPNTEGAYCPMETEADLYPGADFVPGAFRLGFFAAIIVEANNVEIDLNGKEIKVAEEFRLQQRFFANIEIGIAPFIQGQGPANFGDFLSPESGVSNITITNGRVGLSSHHGIHGNAARNVVLSNLKVYDFEVGGIQMNHFSNLIIRNVEVGPSSINVPVTASWGSARFDLLNFRILRDTHGDQVVNFANRMQSKTVEDIIDDLQLTMDMLVDKFVAGELYELNSHITDDSPQHQELYDELFKHSLPLFVNKEGLPDGSSMYGIILNSRGAAVQWFGRAKSRSEDAIIENVRIHNLNNKVLEYGAYRDINGSLNTGPYRELFNLFATLDIGRESLDSVHEVAWRSLGYRGNVLSDAQVALAIYGDANSERGKVKTKITADIINWITKGVDLPSAGQLICNGDVMFHAIKGVIGLRIDNVDRVSINNVEIDYINNWSELGKYICKDQDNNYVSHPTIPTNRYEGTTARALTVTNSQSVSLGNIRIHNIASANGNSYGIEVLDDVSNVEIVGDIYIDHVVAGSCLTRADLGRMNDDPLPNPVPMACGFTDTTNSGAAYLHVSNIRGPTVCT